MFLVLFALFMVLPWALSNNVSTKPGLKIFQDEYQSVTAACLDLGFTKKACHSGSYKGIFVTCLKYFILSSFGIYTCISPVLMDKYAF